MAGELIRVQCPMTIRAIDTEKATVDADVSTIELDRYGTVFLPRAFEARLPSFQKNPILQWMHAWMAANSLFGGSVPGPEFVLGSAERIAISDTVLHMRFRYAVEENPTARMVFNMVRAGHLRAYSIGARIWGALRADHGEEVIDAVLDKLVGNAMARKRLKRALLDGLVRAIYTDAELYEVSQVFVGANPAALAVDTGAQVPAKVDRASSTEELVAAGLANLPAVGELVAAGASGAPAAGLAEIAEILRLMQSTQSQGAIVVRDLVGEERPGPVAPPAPAEVVVEALEDTAAPAPVPPAEHEEESPAEGAAERTADEPIPTLAELVGDDQAREPEPEPAPEPAAPAPVAQDAPDPSVEEELLRMLTVAGPGESSADAVADPVPPEVDAAILGALAA